MNSILLAYKDRPKHLKAFLDALQVSAKQATQGAELIICALWEDPPLPTDPNYDPDLHMHTYDESPEDKIVGDLAGALMDANVPVTWVWEDFTGLFNKSKALNAAADHSKGDLITVLDVDCLVPPDFLASIERFYADPANSRIKLSHRMLLVDPTQTDRIFRFGNNHLTYLRDNPGLYPWNKAAEDYQGHPIGNSQFTMDRQAFADIGGFDERFEGYGLEDTDFNLRAEKNGITTRMNDGINLLHLNHTREATWADPVAEEKNRQLFHQNINDGHPIPIRQRPALPDPCGCFRSKG